MSRSRLAAILVSLLAGAGPGAILVSLLASAGPGAILVSLLAGAGLARAEGESPLFGFQELAFAERTFARLLVDVDGDAARDLVMAFARDPEREDWWLRVCPQREGRFSEECALSRLPPGMRSFDVCRLGAPPTPSLVMLTSEGALRASFAAGRLGSPEPLPGVRSVFVGTDPGIPQTRRICFDLDADGRDELLVPTAAGPRVHRLGAAPQLLASPAFVSFRRRGESLGLDLFLWPREFGRSAETRTMTPDVFVGDFDGDRRPDVVTVLRNTLRVFSQAKDGRFPGEPTLTVSREQGAERDELEGEATAFSDLDGDGRADLVVLRFGGEQRTRMDRSIYFARADGSFPEQPDQLVRSEGLDPRMTILDLNADGKQDLVIPYFHVAASQAVRAFAQQSLRLQLRIFLMRPNGRYGQDEGNPFVRIDRRVVIDYGFDVFELIRDSRSRPEGVPFSPFIHIDADVNGDGFADLLADGGDDRLSIHLGNAEADYRGGPDHEIELESALTGDVLDLDGDARTDLVMWYGEGHVREQATAPPPTREERRRARLDPGRAAREADPEPVPPQPRTRIKLLLTGAAR